MGDVPEYVTRQRAAYELDMSDTTFDKYVREGTLPSPKRRGGMLRWKWSEIVSVLDGEAASNVIQARDAFSKGVAREKEANARTA
jgi:predicted DNA-binding transcriptional regulator AlpA